MSGNVLKCDNIEIGRTLAVSETFPRVGFM